MVNGQVTDLTWHLISHVIYGFKEIDHYCITVMILQIVIYTIKNNLLLLSLLWIAVTATVTVILWIAQSR